MIGAGEFWNRCTSFFAAKKSDGIAELLVSVAGVKKCKYCAAFLAHMQISHFRFESTRPGHPGIVVDNPI